MKVQSLRKALKIRKRQNTTSRDFNFNRHSSAQNQVKIQDDQCLVDNNDNRAYNKIKQRLYFRGRKISSSSEYSRIMTKDKFNSKNLSNSSSTNPMSLSLSSK